MLIHAVHVIISSIFNIYPDKKNDKTFSFMFLIFSCEFDIKGRTERNYKVSKVYFDLWMDKIKGTFLFHLGSNEASITDNIWQIE